MADLSTLFEPDAVVVGATERQGSVGRAVMENMTGFEGEAVPVNPNAAEVLGREADPDLGPRRRSTRRSWWFPPRPRWR